jgi:Mn-dependent DtxR family transcriptional regulator
VVRRLVGDEDWIYRDSTPRPQSSLQDDGDGQPVATSQLAARLHVTAASVSAMIKRLSELGLAEHARYKGVTLTKEGERLALEMLRHHRLLELYLAEHLDVPGTHAGPRRGHGN